MIHITSDHFVWLDVSEKATPLFPFFNLYEVGDDDADHLIEDISTIPSIISYGSRICIEVGHIPQEYLTIDKN
tara:strand:- start:78 stop:296 length:219 start_codon:yes stop_codon:yes gene_type:complete